MSLLGIIVSRKAALAIGSAALSAGILGASALATAPADTAAPAASTSNAPIAAKGGHGRAFDRINDVLSKLVDKGVITAQQKDAILAALKAADERKDKGHDRDDARRFVGDVLQTSSRYLGVSVDDLKTQLKAGQSLAQIANATAGRSRDGLVEALTQAADARIKAAVDAGTLTAEQAEPMRTKVHAAIVKLVDHAGGPTAAR